MTGKGWCIAAAGSLLAAPLAAQQVSLRLGGLATQYADSIDAQAGSAGLRVSLESQRATGTFEASWAQFGGGNAAGQAWGRALLVGPSSRRVALGVRGDGVFNSIKNGPWAGIGYAEPFMTVGAGAVGITAGVSGGGVHKLDGTGQPVAGGSLRLTALPGHWLITASAQGLVAGDTSYVDYSITADLVRPAFYLGALLATRRGDLSTGAWAQGYAGAALSPRVSLEASAGSYPRDITGFDQGRYVNLGLRVFVGRAGSAAMTAPVPASGVPEFEVVRLAGDAVRLTLPLLDATTLAIAGDWNDWAPAPMERTADLRWTVTLPLAAGSHRFALVVDGDRWMVPPGVTRLPDDFGGEYGLLIVR